MSLEATLEDLQEQAERSLGTITTLLLWDVLMEQAERNVKTERILFEHLSDVLESREMS